MVARMDSSEQGAGAARRAAKLAIAAALCLSGCGERAKAPPPPTPPAVAAASGPVNPDPGVTRYACAGGETVTAGYPDRETAIVAYQDHSYTLKLAHAADGARYTGYGLQWWTRGDRASLAQLKNGEETATGPGLECRSAAPEVDSAAQTQAAPAK